MLIYVSTRSVPGASTLSDALLALELRGVQHASVSPGRLIDKSWRSALDRWSDRALLHHACLQPPSDIRWNLAAADRNWRRRSVEGAIDAMRESAERGFPAYSLHAGYALEIGVGPDGSLIGGPEPRHKSLDWLTLSLDTLASRADDLGLALWVENSAGRPDMGKAGDRKPDPATLPLMQEPDEIAAVLERVAAPCLGLVLDTAHLVLSCAARKCDPEPALDELIPWLCALEVSGTDARVDLHRVPRPDGIEIQLAARAFKSKKVPIVMEAANVPEKDHLAFKDYLEAALSS